MRAIALVRVSTDAQSLDRQEDAARAWAASNGYSVEIVAEKVSGCAKKRPGLEEVLARCRKASTRPDAVWVAELSRVGRSLVGVVQVLSELDSLGVRVVVAGAGIDYGGAAGRLQASIIAAFAEYERELIRERTRDGLAAARARGVKLGKRPDEWDAEAESELRRMIADEGLSPYAAWKSRRLTVWRPCKDDVTGEWTTRPVHPGQTAVYQKVEELGLKDE